VSFFTSPDDLATQVTISFVKQRERIPAIGFIRADQSVDHKKYAELLEENIALKTQLSKLRSLTQREFDGSRDILEVDLISDKGQSRIARVTKAQLFIWVADIIMEGNQTDDQMQSYLLQRLSSYQLSEDLF
jgi:hypothetical protein